MIAILVICLIERAKRSGRTWIMWPASLAAVAAGFLPGYAVMADYYGAGVLMVLVFCFWFCYAFYPAHMLLLYLPVCFL